MRCCSRGLFEERRNITLATLPGRSTEDVRCKDYITAAEFRSVLSAATVIQQAGKLPRRNELCVKTLCPPCVELSRPAPEGEGS